MTRLTPQNCEGLLVELVQELAKLWLECRRVLTTPCAGGLGGQVVGGQPFEILPGHQVQPRLGLLFDEVFTPDKVARFEQVFGSDFTRIVVNTDLAVTMATRQGETLILPMRTVLAELQTFALENPNAENIRASDFGRALLFLLEAGYRSPEVPILRRVWHVVPDRGRWALKPQHGEIQSTFPTKDEAIAAGVQQARSSELGQLIIHRRDGRFEEERTYGSDPPGDG